jgi:nucleoside-diphosphate-sugar epimerase
MAATPSQMALTLAITGGTGFVGSHSIDEALRRGHHVRALARRPQPPRDGLDWVPGSLEDGPALRHLVDGADVVLHIAGVTNAATPAGFYAGNVAGTAALRAAIGPLPLVHVSSLSAREPRLSAYGASKYQAEGIARGAAGPVTLLRPPGVYGPGDTDMLALFKAVKAGLAPVPRNALAALIYGPDLAAALVALAEDAAGAGRAAGCILEIDDGTGGYSQPDIVRAIAAVLGVPARPLEVPAVVIRAAALAATAAARLSGNLPTLSLDRAGYLAHPDWTADSARLLSLGLWRPETGISAGMAATALWYRNQGLL